ncbi:MAG: hypothetical protein WAT93_09860 [Pontixanthobacter sp.]
MAIKTSIDLNDNQVTVARFYRCNANTNTPTNIDNCDDDYVVSSSVRLVLTNSYTPVWTDFGAGSPITFDVERTVQLHFGGLASVCYLARNDVNLFPPGFRSWHAFMTVCMKASCKESSQEFNPR